MSNETFIERMLREDIDRLTAELAELERYQTAVTAVTEKTTRYVVFPTEGIAIIDRTELFDMETQLDRTRAELSRYRDALEKLSKGFLYDATDVRRIAMEALNEK